MSFFWDLDYLILHIVRMNLTKQVVVFVCMYVYIYISMHLYMYLYIYTQSLVFCLCKLMHKYLWSTRYLCKYIIGQNRRFFFSLTCNRKEYLYLEFLLFRAYFTSKAWMPFTFEILPQWQWYYMLRWEILVCAGNIFSLFVKEKKNKTQPL